MTRMCNFSDVLKVHEQATAVRKLCKFIRTLDRSVDDRRMGYLSSLKFPGFFPFE